MKCFLFTRKLKNKYLKNELSSKLRFEKMSKNKKFTIYERERILNDSRLTTTIMIDCRRRRPFQVKQTLQTNTYYTCFHDTKRY